jgi:hypothetical protein
MVPNPMKTSLLLLSPAVAALISPVTPRYQYKPGQVFQYRVEDKVVISRRVGTGPEAVLSTQITTMTLRKKVLTFSGGQARVETIPVDGTSETKVGASTSTQVVRPITRIYTLTPTGKEIRQERSVPKGEKDPGPGPLEGLTFTLPRKPVSPGAVWSEVISVRGLDGKQFPATVRSRYVRDASRGGHPCLEIAVTFSGTFTVQPQQAGAKPVPGKLTGTANYYFATDIGQDVEAAGDIKLHLTATQASAPNSPPASQTVHFTTRQTLLK